MNVQFAQRAIEQLAAAPPPVQRAFLKQINYLVRDLGHPSLHAKKYLRIGRPLAGPSQPGLALLLQDG
jgi:hypothetical protein